MKKINCIFFIIVIVLYNSCLTREESFEKSLNKYGKPDKEFFHYDKGSNDLYIRSNLRRNTSVKVFLNDSIVSIIKSKKSRSRNNSPHSSTKNTLALFFNFDGRIKSTIYINKSHRWIYTDYIYEGDSLIYLKKKETGHPLSAKWN